MLDVRSVHRKWQREAIQIDSLRLGSSVVEHLVHIQKAWVQSPVWSLLCWQLTLSASSVIIEDIKAMQKSADALLAMYFYDFRGDLKKDLRGLLSSMLFQLCDQSNSYYNILSTFHSTHHDGAKSPPDEELIRCLVDSVKLPGLPPVFLIVDGLDERGSIVLVGCKAFIPSSYTFTTLTHMFGRFQWVDCQLKYLVRHLLPDLEHALNELLATLDETCCMNVP